MAHSPFFHFPWLKILCCDIHPMVFARWSVVPGSHFEVAAREGCSRPCRPWASAGSRHRVVIPIRFGWNDELCEMRRNNVLSRLSACFFSKNYKLNYIHAVIHIFRTKDGYFHLPGRSELALEVQRRILPRFGFDATKAGGGRWTTPWGQRSDEDNEDFIALLCSSFRVGQCPLIPRHVHACAACWQEGVGEAWRHYPGKSCTFVDSFHKWYFLWDGGSRAEEMIRHCSAYLTDHSIAHLFDAINRSLGILICILLWQLFKSCAQKLCGSI